jgi:hypothetical protein
MKNANVDKSKVDTCMTDSGGLEGDVVNTLIAAEIAAKDASGIVIIPTMIVNSVAIRGQLSFPTAFKAICSGYSRGTEPSICQTCMDCLDAPACVEQSKCTAGFDAYVPQQGAVSTFTFTGTVLGLSVVFGLVAYLNHRRQQAAMRSQVRGILAVCTVVDLHVVCMPIRRQHHFTNVASIFLQEYMPIDINQAHQDNTVGIEQTDGSDDRHDTKGENFTIT